MEVRESELYFIYDLSKYSNYKIELQLKLLYLKSYDG